MQADLSSGSKRKSIDDAELQHPLKKQGLNIEPAKAAAAAAASTTTAPVPLSVSLSPVPSPSNSAGEKSKINIKDQIDKRLKSYNTSISYCKHYIISPAVKNKNDIVCERSIHQNAYYYSKRALCLELDKELYKQVESAYCNIITEKNQLVEKIGVRCFKTEIASSVIPFPPWNPANFTCMSSLNFKIQSNISPHDYVRINELIAELQQIEIMRLQTKAKQELACATAIKACLENTDVALKDTFLAQAYDYQINSIHSQSMAKFHIEFVKLLGQIVNRYNKQVMEIKSNAADLITVKDETIAIQQTQPAQLDQPAQPDQPAQQAISKDSIITQSNVYIGSNSASFIELNAYNSRHLTDSVFFNALRADMYFFRERTISLELDAKAYSMYEELRIEIMKKYNDSIKMLGVRPVESIIDPNVPLIFAPDLYGSSMDQNVILYATTDPYDYVSNNKFILTKFQELANHHRQITIALKTMIDASNYLYKYANDNKMVQTNFENKYLEFQEYDNKVNHIRSECMADYYSKCVSHLEDISKKYQTNISELKWSDWGH